VVFKLWLAWWEEGKAPKHAAQVERRVVADIIPVLRSKPIDDVTAADVRDMMLGIAKRGAKDVARRAHETTSQIFRYAIAHGYAKRNPAADFRPSDIMIKPPTKNFARVDAKDLPGLLKRMDEYNGTGVTKFAMRLLALTFVRTSELIEAPWSEFDLGAARSEIPANRMKMPSPHIVPLSRQALEILRALKMLTGTHALVFPGDVDKRIPMSNNTILKALERMGYKHAMTGHGWRGIASTVLYENGFEEDHVEVQLAHPKRNQVRASYDHAKYLLQRKKLIQWWADYLDEQRANG
jgi:integrase